MLLHIFTALRGMSEPGPGSPASETAASAIATENALPGSTEWALDRPITDQQIVAYPDRESYAAGLMCDSVSAKPAGSFAGNCFAWEDMAARGPGIR